MYKIEPVTETSNFLRSLIRGSIINGSENELDAFFGDLKSAVILIDSEFKIIYLNNTAVNLNITDHSIYFKGQPVIYSIKKILNDSGLLAFYEHLLSKSTATIDNGFRSPKIQSLIVNPISNDGFVLKILFDELHTNSVTNIFKHFTDIPITYFGFDFVNIRRVSIRFLSDNFENFFPELDANKVLEEESYFFQHIHHDDVADFVERLSNLRTKNESSMFEFRMVFADKTHWYRLMYGKFYPSIDKNFWLACIEDIHNEKIESLEKEKLIHEALDDERHRMSMELHDGLGQNLVALNLHLSNIENSNGVEICKNITTDSLFVMKSICYNLAPPELEKGLLHGIDVFFAKNNELSHNIKFEFKATQGSVKKISNEIDYNIFRIVQEFVSNAKKYSQCEKIVCEIKSKKQKSQLIIYDDGIGFDQEKTIKGFGISNIHRRARMINAQISFESEPGNGTRLELVF